MSTSLQKRAHAEADLITAPELSARTFSTFRRELSSLEWTISRRRTPGNVLEELSGVREGPMIIRMMTIPRRQLRHDHRSRDLVHQTGDTTIVTDLGVPRSTARGWLVAAPKAVVSFEVADLTGRNSGTRSGSCGASYLHR